MYRALTCMTVICLLFCVPVAEGKNYAVVISAGQATTDDAPVNSCFWYNPYLQYMTLVDQGFAEDDIYFLYGWGTDFSSSHTCYQPPSPVTDLPVNRANIQSVFNTLAGIMTSSDFVYVWWMGHGSPSGGNLAMNIGTTGETVYDYEIANWMSSINYDVRAFSWMTCYSGGILNDVEGPRSIVMSSATFYESTYDQWLCDTYHAEFHYPERCAWAWETPCGICGSVDADTSNDGRVSFDEAFTYAEANTALSNPQISDLGGLAPTTFLGGGCTTNEECNDGNECTEDLCVEGVCQNNPYPDNTPCTGGICCGGICTVPVCTTNADCDDGEPCTTDECMFPTSCGAVCENTWPACGIADGCCGPTCTPATDPDCFGCDNDGTCELGEDCHNCPNDCISGGGGGCPDGICDPDIGEDCNNCPEDCNSRTTGAPSGRFCCGDDVDCTDARCQVEPYMCGPSPPVYCCGDGVCEGAENVVNCAVDCGCTSPADCDDSNECTIDDCVDGACENTPVADDTPCTGGICCGGSCDPVVCSSAADCDDSEACTIDTCYNGDTCAAYCDNVWPACGIADGCCGPACTPANDPDCDCVPDGGYCTTNEECCSGSCHPSKNYCR